MEIIPFKKPVRNFNEKVFEILKDRQFFAISIYKDKDGTDRYDYHIPTFMFKSQIIYGMEMLKHSIFQDEVEYEE